MSKNLCLKFMTMNEAQLIKEQSEACDKIQAIYDNWERELEENEALCSELEAKIAKIKLSEQNPTEYHDKMQKIYDDLKQKVEDKEKQLEKILDPNNNALLLLVQLENKQNSIEPH